VGGRVVSPDGLIKAAADDGPISHHDSADWHLASRFGESGLVESEAHKVLVCGIGHEAGGAECLRSDRKAGPCRPHAKHCLLF